MPGLFAGKTVFITGASSGIGEAAARAFAAEGARVAMLARRLDRLEEVKKAIEAAGGGAMIFQCDVTDAEGLRDAAGAVAEAWGGIDVALANAGFGVAGQLERLSLDDYRRQFEVNFFGLINTIHAVLPHLKASKGRLGMVASIAGKFGTPSTSAYNSSKAAVISLGESIYHELDECGVSVTVISPGFVESEIRSVNNRGEYTGNPDPVPGWLVMPREKAARQIVSALYRRRPELIITRHAKLACLAQRLFPGLLRRAIRLGTRGKLAKFEAGRRNTKPKP